jgi:hypothetical protein
LTHAGREADESLVVSVLGDTQFINVTPNTDPEGPEREQEGEKLDGKRSGGVGG